MDVLEWLKQLLVRKEQERLLFVEDGQGKKIQVWLVFLQDHTLELHCEVYESRKDQEQLLLLGEILHKRFLV
jgi:hypothetical protein